MIRIENHSQATVLAICCLFATLATVSVSLRFYVRTLQKISLQWDDWCILVALILALGLVACDICGVVLGGVGMHTPDVIKQYGPGPLIAFAKDLVAVQMLWATSLAMMKTSVLFLYIRIFDVGFTKFRMAARFVMVIVALWCLSVILCSVLLCQPFAFNWDQTIPGGHCGDQVLSYIITGSVNIVTDVMVLCLPMPMIWKLQMPTSSKIALTVIFAIGFFICIVSIVRTVSLTRLTYSDITYSVPIPLIWSMLEPTLGITIACLPVIRPLFLRGAGSTRDQSGSYKSSGSRFDARNFQNLDQQQLYPLKGAKRETVIRRTSQGDESLDVSSMQSDEVKHLADSSTAHLDPSTAHLDGGITVRQEFCMKDTDGKKSKK